MQQSPQNSKHPMYKLLLLPLIALTTTSLAEAQRQPAPIKITFWHAMSGAAGLVEQQAAQFNRQQKSYRVTVRSFANYQKLLSTWQKSHSNRNTNQRAEQPTLLQLELSNYSRLAATGQLHELSNYTGTLPQQLVNDISPNVWKIGQMSAKRWALPWNISVPVLLYNGSLVKKSPTTWKELASSVKQLHRSKRATLLVVPDSWTFEANVISRGGQLVNKNGQPQLNSPVAVQTLSSLRKMVSDGSATLRRLDEAGRSAFDFATGKHAFVMASVANWSDARKLPFFQLGVAPLPCQQRGCSVSLGGGVLAVSNTASHSQTKGVLQFWQFLMQPKIQAQWVKQTAYLPFRKASQRHLKDWYRQHPQLKLAHNQLHQASARPQLANYSQWLSALEGQLYQALAGKVSSKAALNKAQSLAQATQ